MNQVELRTAFLRTFAPRIKGLIKYKMEQIKSEVEEIIQKLKRSGDLFEPKRGFISRI